MLDSLILVSLVILSLVLWSLIRQQRTNKSSNESQRSSDASEVVFGFQIFDGEMAGARAQYREELVFTKQQFKEYEKGLRIDSAMFNAEERKDFREALKLRQELARNESWAYGVGKGSAYHNVYRVALGLCDSADFDEAFGIASSMLTEGIAPWGPEQPLSYGFYHVETLALDVMSAVCRRQGHLRDAIYQNVFLIKAQAFEMSRNKRLENEISNLRWLASKPRITDASCVLGARNEIAKILELTPLIERTIAGLVREYVDALVAVVNTTKESKDAEQRADEIFNEYQRKILDLIPVIPKNEMVALTQAFDTNNK